MSGWIIPPHGLIEPVPAPEIYCDGIGAIERLDHGTICVHFVREHLPLEGGAPQRVVVAKLFRPMEGVAYSIGQLAQCLAPSVVPPAPPGQRPIVVK